MPRKKTAYGFTPEMIAKITALAELHRACQAERRLKIQRRAQRRLTKLHARKYRWRMSGKRMAEVRGGAGSWQLPAAGGPRGRRMALLGWQVVAARMVEGEWYSRRDLYALAPEYAETSIEAWLYQKLLARGLVDRAPNADFDKARAPGRQSEPRWLFRLSDRGAREVAGWREVLLGSPGALEA